MSKDLKRRSLPAAEEKMLKSSIISVIDEFIYDRYYGADFFV
ncbi:hypothetical protein [Streptococcus macacae]|uniref:Uncharacterized protein n=1 Tax=Streptococcus macacae NCTC 11558 TaxID=764298 RepID=G5JYP8_9STRE|nr:hypothetical protein [Streptococcus macacae]EHJ53032.1 hypothetical protein STRMA_0311 [Streptococcus macacae NCTC 11558]